MIFKVPILTMMAALLAVPVRAPASGSPPAPLTSHRNSIALINWARIESLNLRWLERDKRLELSSHNSRFVFEINSCQARVNGVGVRLSFPPTLQNGTVMISPVDLNQTLLPLLKPAQARPGRTITTICLDPGHGGKDPGEHLGGRLEKSCTLQLARELREQLLKAGFKVILTRTSDTTMDLTTRTELARRRQADLFLSLHFNSSPEARSDVRGIETYCLTPAGARSSNTAAGQTGDTRILPANRNNSASLRLAYLTQKKLVQQLGAEDRGVKRARYEVLREAEMPAILIEGGFLSHPTEGKKIFEPAYRKQMAQAILQGVVAYQRGDNS